jgi:hypothetical protein
MRRQVSANVQEALVRSYVSFKRWIVHILAVREGFKAWMVVRPCVVEGLFNAPPSARLCAN